VASGTVEWFTDASDYGFVVPDEIGGDLCTRGSNVDATIGTRLTEGDRAEFQARVAGMGPEAIEVLPLRARQDLRCACGYGIVASGPLPACPMCGASAWEESAQARPPRTRSGAKDDQGTSLRRAAAAKKSVSGAL
jgi:cold shock CspA family protein